MSDRSDNRVAVIGGGVAGLVSAKVLRQDGFEVTVFEKESTLGGVWAESRAYPGLRTNNPRETYAFADFDYPDSSSEFPTAAEVRRYLASYAERFGIAPDLRLATEVISVSRRGPDGSGSPPGFRVAARRVREPTRVETADFDFVVICNGVFSEPYVPRLEGRTAFRGQVLHSSELTDPETVRGRRVVVVGAGKSALDCATFAAQEAASTTLVFRQPHWMIPRYFGRKRVDHVLFTRFSLQVFPAYHNATRTERALRRLGTPLFWLWRTAVSRYCRRIGRVPAGMVPERPVTSGIENNGIGTEFFEVVREGRARTRRARIESFSAPDRVRLDTGEELESDVVVFATGWRQSIAFLDAELRREILRDGWFRLYRHILPPQERRLGFVGYASSGNAPLTSEIAAHWLSQSFRGELPLPDASAMDGEIDRVRSWTRNVFPRRNGGYFIGAYFIQYVDELLRDMGLPTRRAPSFFAEHWGPLWGSRYRNVAAERRRLRRGDAYRTAVLRNRGGKPAGVHGNGAAVAGGAGAGEDRLDQPTGGTT